MKFLPCIKQYLTRTPAAVDQPATSSDKSAWKAPIKRWGSRISPGGKAAFEFLHASFVVISLVLAFVLFVAILGRIFDESEVNWIDCWLGTSHLAAKAKLETIKILGQGLGVIIGIYVVYRRARASDKIAQAHHNANEQKLFNDANTKLAHKSDIVRLGGIYALQELAESNKNYLARITKILCAHLREETTRQGDDKEKDKKKDKEKYAEQYKDKPSNEIQSLLEVLSELNKLSEEKQGDGQFSPVRLNLSGAYLDRCRLKKCVS